MTEAVSKTCNVSDCDNAHHAKGWCKSHYIRWSRHGDPLGGGTYQGEPAAFLESAMSYDGDECLFWPYSRNADGYGRIWIDGATKSPHRIVCENTNGPPPTQKHFAAHSCGNGHLGCIAKRHLRWATPSENVLEMHQHGRHRRKLTESDARKIRSLQGMPDAKVADIFGVRASHINKIRNRKIWGSDLRRARSFRDGQKTGEKG